MVKTAAHQHKDAINGHVIKLASPASGVAAGFGVSLVLSLGWTHTFRRGLRGRCHGCSPLKNGSTKQC